MGDKKQEAWFVKVGPFGGLFPINIKGLAYTLFMVLIMQFPLRYVAKFADENRMGEAFACFVASLFLFIFMYAFASRRSKKY